MSWLVWIPLAALATAALSGLFGMGGGLILMGLLAARLPVREAMLLHAAAQLASNGSRAWFLREHVHWPALGWTGLGALPVVLVLAQARLVVSSDVMYLLLGALPLGATLVPARRRLCIEDPRAALVCGAVTTAAQLTAGASGPLLDAFYLGSSLDRLQVVATKAVTQTLGHVLKLVYFGTLVGGPALELAPAAFALAAAGAVLGTRAGGVLLGRIREREFRRWSRWLVTALSLTYLWKGLAR